MKTAIALLAGLVWTATTWAEPGVGSGRTGAPQP